MVSKPSPRGVSGISLELSYGGRDASAVSGLPEFITIPMPMPSPFSKA